MDVTEKVNRFIELNNQIVKGLLEKQGQLHPMLVVLSMNHKQETQVDHYTIPLPSFDTEQGKQYIAKNLIPMILRKTQANGLTILCVGFFMDAWITMHKYEGTDIGAAKDAAMKERKAGTVKRQSVLLCCYETNLIAKNFRFNYDTPNGKVVWGETDINGELFGRFANLWKTPAYN